MLTEYDGRVRLVFKDFPLAIHDRARAAHEAARCAGALGQYWAYHDRLFREQPDFGREALIGYAADLGLAPERFRRCLDEGTYAREVEADIAQGRALGITATPTFFVNGRTLIGAHPVENFRAVIEEALRAAR